MKNKIAILTLVILGVVIAYWRYNVLNHRTSPISPKSNSQKITTSTAEGNMNDLVSFSIKPGQEVSGKMTVAGSVKGGYFFEANIGVNILDENKKLLKQGYGTAQGEWMTSEPVSFTANLDFTGTPKGPAFIEIKNDNASGDPKNDKHILIPVIIK